jgi:hypothetical protein
MCFYLYNILQNKQNTNNPRTEGDMKESIPEGVGGGIAFNITKKTLTCNEQRF